MHLLIVTELYTLKYAKLITELSKGCSTRRYLEGGEY